MTVNTSRIESLPGRAGAFVLDVKEVSDIKSSYNYNFYEVDENNPNRLGFEITKTQPAIDTNSSFITVDFSKPESSTEANQSLINFIRDLTLEVDERSELPGSTGASINAEEKLDFNKIISENDLGGNFFTGITLGIPNETGILRDLIKEASSVVIDATQSESSINQSTTDFIQSYSSALRESGFIFSEIYKNDLPRFFSSLSNENLGREKVANAPSYLNYEANVTYYSSLLNNIASDIINNSTSIFSNSVKSEIETINNITTRARNAGDPLTSENPISNYFPTINSTKIYDSQTIFDAIETETNQFNIKDQLYNDIEYIGIMVKLKITLKNGTVVTMDPKIIIDTTCEQVFIKNPPYGSSVGVKIVPLYILKIPVYKKQNEILIKTTGVLFVSGKGKSVTSSAVDTVPPQPPQDLTFNLTNAGLEISWSLPFNKQRDISKFRIFKRNNKNESFTLIKQIEFGGIEDKNVPDFLNEKPVNQDGRPIIKTYCVDNNFNKHSSAIYAVTCVDVHDLTSNYSEQIHVKINPVFNRLETRLFGRLGAYIQYPNMTMEEEVFDGVIKASGYQKAKIYFNPDFLRIYYDIPGLFKKQEDLINIGPNDDNLFKLNLINIDLQEQQNLDIIIGERITVSEFDSADSAIVKSFLDEDTSLS